MVIYQFKYRSDGYVIELYFNKFPDHKQILEGVQRENMVNSMPTLVAYLTNEKLLIDQCISEYTLIEIP